MIEILIEVLVSGIFELFAEGVRAIVRAIARAFRPNREAPRPRQNWSAEAPKLLVGVAGGFAWGYYVFAATDMNFPRAFWNFVAFGAITFTMRLTNYSNEEFTSRIQNRFIRDAVTLTPQRFTGLTSLSFTIAISMLAGFVLPGVFVTR